MDIPNLSTKGDIELARAHLAPARGSLRASFLRGKLAGTVTGTVVEDICRRTSDGTHFAAFSGFCGGQVVTTAIAPASATARLRTTDDLPRHTRRARDRAGAPLAPLRSTCPLITRLLLDAASLRACIPLWRVALPGSLNGAVATRY